ncbi:hypothetical protein SAMN02745111_01691 [Eubacterium uniforme]|uniref:Uncharacterized protein n=1 Tax=Eubacterium uniforme TaxID=39495 RepID=A0A1T4VVJ9_9FIRM|nr:hypothetical protein [Eubacterium uniforme]SKA68939.1 hypothetical protein SAMN02745111_01691 [Eubacterium uniforme]
MDIRAMYEDMFEDIKHKIQKKGSIINGFDVMDRFDEEINKNKIINFYPIKHDSYSQKIKTVEKTMVFVFANFFYHLCLIKNKEVSIYGNLIKVNKNGKEMLYGFALSHENYLMKNEYDSKNGKKYDIKWIDFNNFLFKEEVEKNFLSLLEYIFNNRKIAEECLTAFYEVVSEYNAVLYKEMGVDIVYKPTEEVWKHIQEIIIKKIKEYKYDEKIFISKNKMEKLENRFIDSRYRILFSDLKFAKSFYNAEWNIINGYIQEKTGDLTGYIYGAIKSIEQLLNFIIFSEENKNRKLRKHNGRDYIFIEDNEDQVERSLSSYLNFVKYYGENEELFENNEEIIERVKRLKESYRNPISHTENIEHRNNIEDIENRVFELLFLIIAGYNGDCIDLFLNDNKDDIYEDLVVYEKIKKWIERQLNWIDCHNDNTIYISVNINYGERNSSIMMYKEKKIEFNSIEVATNQIGYTLWLEETERKLFLEKIKRITNYVIEENKLTDVICFEIIKDNIVRFLNK